MPTNPSEPEESSAQASGSLIRADELLGNTWPLSLALSPNQEDGAFIGSCPCAVIHGEGFEVRMKCWRVTCGASAINISGTLPKETLHRIAEHIRDHNGWTQTTDWTIHVSPSHATAFAPLAEPAASRS